MDPPRLEEPNVGAGQRPQVQNMSHHPSLNSAFVSVNIPNTCTYHCHAGTPCNHAGQYLPPNSLPSLNPSPVPDDYSPYESRVTFHLTEVLYSHEQMSAAKINKLLAIMASMYDKDPPFHSHKDLYDTIDATMHGNSPWQSFSVTYSGALPDDLPAWMTAEYDVWFHDPKVMLEHQLMNPDFKGEINLSEYMAATWQTYKTSYSYL